MFYMEHSNIPEHLQIGVLGEDIACAHLEEKGFVLVERNYRKKWGEIDLIMKNDSKLHFVEVKTVSHGTIMELRTAVARKTYRPEERVDGRKLKRLGRAIETWRLEKREGGDFQLDVVTVRVVPREKYAAVEVIEQVA